MKYSLKTNFFAILLAVFIFSSCSQPGVNKTGSEYMPDMGRSLAYDANLYNYYYQNTWDSLSVKKLKTLSIPGKPIKGTVPRGYAGVATQNTRVKKAEMMAVLTGETQSNGISIPLNGYVPFHYADSEEGRNKATAEITQNPFPITDRNLEIGKQLYDINCGICHGSKGDGVGWLVDEKNANAKYPAQPANFVQGDLLTASDGRYYYAIMYGKNVMGGYADKLSYKERWQVIQYIRSLQAKVAKADYSPAVNTFNNDIPGETLAPVDLKIKKSASEYEMTQAAASKKGHHDKNHGHNNHNTEDHSHEGGDHHEEDSHSAH